MVATQYGIKYAVHIITNHFGNLVAKVCECLLCKGPLTLQNIARCTELNALQVKDSLLVLIQHNCVQAFILEQPGAFGDGSKPFTQYMVLFDNIIHRPRFCKFLNVVYKEFGVQSFVLLEGLLQHGRLTLKQMVDRAKASQNEKMAILPNAVQGILLRLVAAHYVERCPTPESVLAMETEGITTGRRRVSKYAKIIKEPKTLEQRVLAAAMPIEAIRFSFIADTERDAYEEKAGNDHLNAIVGDKCKHSNLVSDKEFEAAKEAVVLWRVNFEEFMRHFRHKACFEIVKTHLDVEAAAVFSTMLEATRNEERKLKTEKSVPLLLSSIYEEVIDGEKGRNMTFDRIRACLVQLGSLTFVREFDESYSIDFKNIIELAQNLEVESVVLKKYGKKAYKMFRLLSKEGCLLETDKIAYTTFVDKEDAPEILYKLWKDDYLHMEKLVLTGTRQSQFLLWKVNKHTLWEHILDEMFHASLNLCQRMAYEVERHKQLSIIPSSKVDGQRSGDSRIKDVRMVLESSLIKLDDGIMLFNDF